MSESTITIGEATHTVPTMTARKIVRLGRLVSKVGRSTPEILEAWGDFRADYERKHRIELDRAQALMRYGPQQAVRQLPGEAEGSVIYEPMFDEHGDPVMEPGPLSHLTEEDWKASGNMLRLPSTPSGPEQIAAVFPLAFDAAEEYIVQIVGLVLVDNNELNNAARDGGGSAVDELLNKKGNEILDVATGDQILEILVIAGEKLEEQKSRAMQKVGERAGKALNLVGLGSLIGKSESGPSSKSKPTSSTDSPAPTDGPPTTPSTESSSDSSPSLATA